MSFKSIVAALGFAAAASGAALNQPRAACNADYCLRALRASQIPGRLEQVSSDCNTFWVETVTPPAVTITNTATVSTTLVFESHATETNTISETVTSTVFDVSTVTVEPTSTSIIFDITHFPVINKRAASVSGLPAYASPCSNASRFTSACSCVGVTTARTVTAPTPTVTIMETEISSFSRTTTITSTDLLTKTATETQTAITSTKTVGGVAIAMSGQFKMEVRWTQTGILKYAKLITANGDTWVVPVYDFSTANVFSIDMNTGSLFTVSEGQVLVVYTTTPSAGTIGTSLKAGPSVPSGSTKIMCTLMQSTGAITCGVGSLSYFTIWSANSSNLLLYNSGMALNSVRAVPAQ